MRKIVFNPILVTLILLLTYSDGNACTTFCLKDSNNLVVGKNFDFYTGIGHVVINKRNVRKLSFHIPSERRFEWTSKYGSITFNQLGKEFPYGGINEKGLVIEQMYLAETNYPEMDERYGIAELQWIQFQLDNAASVDDVLASNSIVRISRIGTAPLHFLVADAKGNIATIEYLDGKMVYHTKSKLPVCALSNNTYNQSKDYLTAMTNEGKQLTTSFASNSFDRFAKAALMTRDFNSQDVINYAFDILGAVKQGDFTRWSIVYDIKNMTVHYKTQNNPEARVLHMATFDFSCSPKSLYIDINESIKNLESDFHPYSYQKNRAILDVTFDALRKTEEFKHLIPGETETELVARYPETTECK